MALPRPPALAQNGDDHDYPHDCNDHADEDDYCNDNDDEDDYCDDRNDKDEFCDDHDNEDDFCDDHGDEDDYRDDHDDMMMSNLQTIVSITTALCLRGCQVKVRLAQVSPPALDHQTLLDNVGRLEGCLKVTKVIISKAIIIFPPRIETTQDDNHHTHIIPLSPCKVTE